LIEAVLERLNDVAGRVAALEALEMEGLVVGDIGDLEYAVPALTLSTANAEGAAETVIRSDATLLVFDATNPADISTAAATGSAGTAARRDHVHDHPAGLGVDLHHNQSHVLTGGDHTESGLAAGHVLRATAADAFAFGALQVGDLPDNGANPTASVGLAAVNGVASTWMRSDGAPALDQGIAPTWTAAHIFSNTVDLAQYLRHSGDTDTYLEFTDDQIDFYAGAVQFLTLDETTQDILIVNAGQVDMDFRVDWNTGTSLFVLGSNGHVGINDTSPDATLHVTQTNDAGVSALLLEAGTNGELATPNGEMLRIGHFDAVGPTFTERMNMAIDGHIQIHGVLELGEEAVASGYLETDELMYFNTDRTNNDSNSDFIFGTNRTGAAGGTELFRITDEGRVGIGAAAPGSTVEINLATEDLEFVDAGSAGATEQDWLEVQIGGNTGYIRVFASK
jgi:hypothetical protein